MTALTTEPQEMGGGGVEHEAVESDPGFLTHLATAAHFEPGGYLAIASNPAATWKVALVVGLGGLARGAIEFGEHGALGLAQTVAAGFLAWAVIASLVWRVARRAATREVSWAEAMRGIGLAAYPFLLLVVAQSAASQAPLLLAILVGTHALAAFAFVSATREIFGLGLPLSFALCGVSVAILAAPFVLVGGIGIG